MTPTPSVCIRGRERLAPVRAFNAACLARVEKERKAQKVAESNRAAEEMDEEAERTSREVDALARLLKERKRLAAASLALDEMTEEAERLVALKNWGRSYGWLVDAYLSGNCPKVSDALKETLSRYCAAFKGVA